MKKHGLKIPKIKSLSFLSKLYGGRGMTSLADLRCSIFSKKKDRPKSPTNRWCCSATHQTCPSASSDLEGSRSGGTPGLTWLGKVGSLTIMSWPQSKVQPLHHLQFCKVLLAAANQLLHVQTKGVAVMQVACTAYCKCGADDICANKYTQSMTLVEAHDDTSDDESDNDDYY